MRQEGSVAVCWRGYRRVDHGGRQAAPPSQLATAGRRGRAEGPTSPLCQGPARPPTCPLERRREILGRCRTTRNSGPPSPTLAACLPWARPTARRASGRRPSIGPGPAVRRQLVPGDLDVLTAEHPALALTPCRHARHAVLSTLSSWFAVCSKPVH